MSLIAVLVAPRAALPEIRMVCDFRGSVPLCHLAKEGAAEGWWVRLGAQETALETMLHTLWEASHKEMEHTLTLLAKLQEQAPALGQEFDVLDLEVVQLGSDGPRVLHGWGLRRAVDG
ncbi:MAG: hypothetical protein JRH20_29885 [Deltaproteobacteria bacterium]|nr:hypothetical protein [Deltaproteobacteria bacterium]